MKDYNKYIFIVCSVNTHTQLRYIKAFTTKNDAIKFWKEKTNYEKVPRNIEKGFELYLGNETIYFLKEELI